MPAGTASYSDTRSFTGGTLYPKVAAFIKNRIKAAAQDAKGEKSAAAMAMGVGSRNDGVTKKEFDNAYGRGSFFRKALGKQIGIGGKYTNYAAKANEIKGNRPLQGPVAPKYQYSYDRMYSDVLGSAAEFNDQSLVKPQSPIVSGAGVGTSIVDNRSNDKTLAQLVDKNSRIFVTGFSAINTALSSFLGAVQNQVKSARKNRREEEIDDKNVADQIVSDNEEDLTEIQDAEAGNRSPTETRFGQRTPILKKLAKLFVKKEAGGLGAGGPTSNSIFNFTGSNTPSATPKASNPFPYIATGGPRLYAGGTFAGGQPQSIVVGDTPKGVPESIIPMSRQTFVDSSKAKIKVLKKNRGILSDMFSDGARGFFIGLDGWEQLAKALFEGIKKLFNQESSSEQEDISSSSSDMVGDGSHMSTLAAIAALESGTAQGRADVAQSVYNRVGDGTYGGSVNEVLTADGQYQPTFVDPTASSGDGTRTADIWKSVNNEDSAVAAMQYYYEQRGISKTEGELRKEYRSSLAAISNPVLRANAAEHVGGRTEFLSGASFEQGDAYRGGPGDNTFFVHYGSGNQLERGAVPIPASLLNSGVIRSGDAQSFNNDNNNFFAKQITSGVRDTKTRKSSFPSGGYNEKEVLPGLSHEDFGLVAFTPTHRSGL